MKLNRASTAGAHSLQAASLRRRYAPLRLPRTPGSSSAPIGPFRPLDLGAAFAPITPCPNGALCRLWRALCGRGARRPSASHPFRSDRARRCSESVSAFAAISTLGGEGRHTTPLLGDKGLRREALQGARVRAAWRYSIIEQMRDWSEEGFCGGTEAEEMPEHKK